MKKYYLHLDDPESKMAGSKAVNDCEKIMDQMQYEAVSINRAHSNKIIRYIKGGVQLFKIIMIEKKSELIVEHPMYINRIYMSLLKLTKNIKNSKLVFIIHDLELLRKLLKDDNSMKRDKMMLNLADVIIAHNEKMSDYLIQECHVDKKKVVILGLFDYLVSADKEQSLKKSEEYKERNRIIIAGNLSEEKSKYIYKLSNLNCDKIKFNLYGVNLSESKLGSNCNYKGAFSPGELPYLLDGGFGLVWDGETLDTCEGSTGNYMRYNNPHKVSLYISAAIPILIWKEAALADFVKKENIGITIENLSDLERQISEISEETYLSMKKNIEVLSHKVKSGEYLRKALNECQAKLEQ